MSAKIEDTGEILARLMEDVMKMQEAVDELPEPVRESFNREMSALRTHTESMEEHRNALILTEDGRSRIIAMNRLNTANGNAHRVIENMRTLLRDNGYAPA